MLIPVYKIDICKLNISLLQSAECSIDDRNRLFSNLL